MVGINTIKQRCNMKKRTCPSKVVRNERKVLKGHFTNYKMGERTNLLESATRKKIDLILNNLGWNTDETSENCSVFTERVKTTEQKKKLNGKFPDYVLYKSKTDEPIAIIEAKRSGQSLKKALEQAIDLYAKPLDIKIIFVTDGTIIETFDIRSNSTLKIDEDVITDFLTEKQLLKFVEEGAFVFSPDKVAYTKRELIKIFEEADGLLRKEGLREGVERFTEFSNLLFLKLISEIEEDRDNIGEGRILEKKYCWESFYQLDAERMLEYINNIILPRLVDKYNHSGDVFQKELLIKNPENLKKIVDKLSKLKLLDTDSDIKGDAFEYFLKKAVSVGTDLGEYFTPRHIVKTIYGRELTGTSKIAKMNMIIIGDGHTNINQMDSLSKPVKNEYDVVLTNFPFSQKTDYNSLYGFNSEDANPVFLKHVIDALNKNGVAGVVVPEGLLFDENSEYVKVRKYLLENYDVEAVIKLHEFVFKPYTGQPTSILIFRRGHTKKVWFFVVKEDGFRKTGSKLGRPPIKENDLILLRQLWKDKESSEHSFSVELDRIKNNNFKLSMDNYRKSTKKKTNRVKLGDICKIMIGGTPAREELKYWNGNNLWVKIRDMKNTFIYDTEEKITNEGIRNSNVKLLPKGTLLFSFKLTIGKVSIAEKELYTNEAIAGIIPKGNNVLTKYLYYLLPKLDYGAYSQSATKGKTLNSKIMASLEITLPSLEEQKRIVKQLDKKEEDKQKSLKEAKGIQREQDIIISQYL